MNWILWFCWKELALYGGYRYTTEDFGMALFRMMRDFAGGFLCVV
jgi:hypothetical protein